jgi:two-component system, chemotaxis family, CheB/CheR fusion protein
MRASIFPAHSWRSKSIEPAVPVQISVVAPETRAGASRILHIEDDPSVAQSVARVLRLRGFEVASAATREEVVHHLEVNGFNPDLILTDLQLGPDVIAETLVAEIAARLRFKPPVIVISGTSGQNREHARSFADRILTKPVDIQVLLREIEGLLGARPSTNRES